MSGAESVRELAAVLGDRYAIERELGRGGMGAVYLARDLRLDRNVAIKTLQADLGDDQLLRERFLRETRVAASFSHPNIVPVHAVEEVGDSLALIMGYVEGESLADRVKRAGPLTTRECVRLLQDVGYALAYAHGRGVVHRDIKPDNIMLERATGRALLMDFGVSRAITKGERTGATRAMTRIGEVVGTPEYMSPEQAAGEELDGRSDIYSLGLTAYFAVVGAPPFSGDSAQRTIVRQLTETPPSIVSLRTDIPSALGDVIDRCLLKDRDGRYTDAAALVDAVDTAGAAAPETPVAIRIFASELASFGLVLVFIAIFLWFYVFTVIDGSDSDDPLLPIVILIAVVSIRFAQSVSEARRLMTHGGFTVDDILRGLRSGLDERTGQRETLKRDPTTQQARKRTVRIAMMLLASVPISFWAAMQFRYKTGPKSYYVSWPGLILLLTSLLSLGIAFPLLIRSPFRRSPGERMFAAVWLGWPGRLLLRWAARGAPSAVLSAKPGVTIPTALRAVNARSGTAASSAAPASVQPIARTDAAVVAMSTSTPYDERLAELDARVTRLEERAAEAGR